MTKQKPSPNWKQRKRKMNASSQLQHKNSRLKIASPTTKGRTAQARAQTLSPVAQPLKVLHRWQRFWPKPSFTLAEKAFAVPEVKGLLMEAVNDTTGQNRKRGCWVSHYIIFMWHKSSAAQDNRVIASAAYRSGRKANSEYYGEDSDHQKKGAAWFVRKSCCRSYAPPSSRIGKPLWKKWESGTGKESAACIQLFDIALQNEFPCRRTSSLQGNFYWSSLWAGAWWWTSPFTPPDKDDGRHFQSSFPCQCPIRPLDEHGRWGNKQRREYLLDEHGERIRDEAGNYVFNAVPTTDWGSPDTLEHWRQAWAELCNQKFAERNWTAGLTTAVMSDRASTSSLLSMRVWPSELWKQRASAPTRVISTAGSRRPTIWSAIWKEKSLRCLIGWKKRMKNWASRKFQIWRSFLSEYYTNRNAGAWSQKAKIGNLKEVNEICNYLMQNKLTTPEELQERVSMLSDRIDTLKNSCVANPTARKSWTNFSVWCSFYTEGKPIADKLATIKWKGKSGSSLCPENENAPRLYHMAERKLKPHFGLMASCLSPHGAKSVTVWNRSTMGKRELLHLCGGEKALADQIQGGAGHPWAGATERCYTAEKQEIEH